MTVRPREDEYLVNGRGKRVRISLSMDQYRKILEELEEVEFAQAYDATKSSGCEAIQFEPAVDQTTPML